MEDIRDIRRQLGLTQIEFADRLGLHQSTISRLEGGSLPVDKRTSLAAKALLATLGNEVVGCATGCIIDPSVEPSTAESAEASTGQINGLSGGAA